MVTERPFFEQEVYVNGARVIRADIIADNGVVHIIDTFLGQPLDPGDGVPLLRSAQGYVEDVGIQQTNEKLRSR